MGTRRRILQPSRVEGICCGDTPQVSKARDEGGGSGHADFSMAALEDLRAPGHAVWHRRPKSEAYHEKAAVTSPSIVRRKGDREQTSNLDADSGGEYEGTGAVESVRNWHDKYNGNEVHLLPLV